MRNFLQTLILTISFLAIACNEPRKPGPGEEKSSTVPIDSVGKIEISIPEAYELSNIILALTEYGRTDKWEVEQNTDYYKEVISYFEPVKDHPLLKKVNYSRELWEDYLSFRTDAAVYTFDPQHKLKRQNNFHANENHAPFDKHEDLINDFVQKSKFREFYTNHKPLYNSIIANYSSYYMIAEMKKFFDKEIGYEDTVPDNYKYKIILSPLVGRMNCHRDIDSNTTADFSNVAIFLVQQHDSSKTNQAERALEIHTIFTEMDHDYVNPITTRHEEEVEKKFDNKKWDINSGYEGVNCFNEYMTWAIYDLFLDKYFPDYSDSLSQQWHYQNASRGFYASDLFAKKLKALYKSRKENEKLEQLYPKILNYCSSIQGNISQPKLLSQGKGVKYVMKDGKLELRFSTKMKKDFDKISCIVTKTLNGKPGQESKTITLSQSNVVQWKSDTDLILKMDTDYNEFEIVFNWWGCRYPLQADFDVMLVPYSLITVKKQ